MRSVSLCALALVCLCINTVSATVGWDNCTGIFVGNNHPSEVANAVRVCRDGVIAISYDVDMIDPSWSAYYVTPADVAHEITGRDEFYEDPDLKSLGVTQAKTDSKAFNETWNKGHVCPNHIMSRAPDTKHATFTMANVAPQAAKFNQRPWGELEDHVYKWIQQNVALNIVTGIAFKDRSNPKMAADNVAIPDYYFKVVCDVENRESVGVVGSNDETGNGTTTLHSVQYVEGIFGGDLFPSDTCRTSSVSLSHWWSDSEFLGLRKSGLITSQIDAKLPEGFRSRHLRRPAVSRDSKPNRR